MEGTFAEIKKYDLFPVWIQLPCSICIYWSVIPNGVSHGVGLVYAQNSSSHTAEVYCFDSVNVHCPVSPVQGFHLADGGFSSCPDCRKGGSVIIGFSRGNQGAPQLPAMSKGSLIHGSVFNWLRKQAMHYVSFHLSTLPMWNAPVCPAAPALINWT